MYPGTVAPPLGPFEPLRRVPNLQTLVEQVDNAATQATVFMRLMGLCLGTTGTVPVQADVDRYLRQLVIQAYDGFVLARDEAKTQGDNVADFEVEGFSTDDRLFDVYVTGLKGHPGSYTASIFIRLV